MEEKEKRVLIVDDGSKQVKEAIAALDAIETTRVTEGMAIPLVIETRERAAARGPVLPILSLMGIGDTNLPYALRKKPKPLKRCLVCKKEHNHNNSFCSPECCKSFKNKNRVL